jgi:polyphosphate glucokinase
MMNKSILGIDVGGTGMKSALIDVFTGEMLTEKVKYATPKPATPQAVVQVIKEMIDKAGYNGPVGCGFPSVLLNGKVMTATNLDSQWLGTDLASLFSDSTGLPFYVINDADVAGIAEVQFGAATHVTGLVVMITLGTGVGSGMLVNKTLIHNTELGFLPMKGGIAELRISNKMRKMHHLSWVAWGKRLNEFLKLVNTLFHPEMIILGGGVCKQFGKFERFTKIGVPVVPAALQNNAGCIGAAYYAAQQSGLIKG